MADCGGNEDPSVTVGWFGAMECFVVVGSSRAQIMM
jgi:hypothetical protein